jgi:isoprenylcysteine carboxyl methyltransferase (ICMT) family protein YpbQ
MNINFCWIEVITKNLRAIRAHEGVNVQKLAMLLKHQLVWYTRKNLPEYANVVCAVLTNKKVVQEDIYKNFKRLFIL